MKEFNEMSYDDLEKHVEEAIKALRQRAYGEGYKQGRFDVDIEGTYGKQEETKSPQQIRDEIVARAKVDLVNLLDTVKFTFLFTGRNIQVLAHFNQDEEQYETLDEVKFVVNSEKRTVVSLAYYAGRVVLRGIAKADPSDCFNVHLGKVIALRRALSLEVPVEYYNAPAPTEVRVGDFLKFNGVPEVIYEVLSTKNNGENLRIIADEDNEEYNLVGATADGDDFKRSKIIDDSRSEENN